MLEMPHPLHENQDMSIDNCKILEMYIVKVKEYRGNLKFTPFAQIFDGTQWTFVLKGKDLNNIETLSVEIG